IYLAANYHKLDPLESGEPSTKVWDLAGTYDFGVAKLGAVYGQRKVDDVKVKQWALTGAVPVGAAGKVQASYGQRKVDADGAEPKVSQWALGYEHALSKRTALYAAYAQQNQNREQEAISRGDFGSDAKALFGAGIGDASDSGAAGYQRGFNLGVRHSF
ncbi:MAG: porin, partial [Proteobacteria bacterium]|nr:porin [Pseudomonadota bacterium]